MTTERRETIARLIHDAIFNTSGQIGWDESGTPERSRCLAAVDALASSGAVVLDPDQAAAVTGDGLSDDECAAISRAAHLACMLRWVNPRADATAILTAMTEIGLTVIRADLDALAAALEARKR